MSGTKITLDSSRINGCFKYEMLKPFQSALGSICVGLSPSVRRYLRVKGKIAVHKILTGIPLNRTLELLACVLLFKICVYIYIFFLLAKTTSI
jgi:hypothetical protein